MNKTIKIAPSLLSSDFANLASEIDKCNKGGADIIHVDVMDGHFVPNITIGPLIVDAIRPLTDKVIDCHLMISDPDKYIPAFAEAGADLISVHVEATNHLHRSLSLIREHGKKAGIAINPATPMEYVYEAAEFADFVMLMSVNPGFGGQKFISSFVRRCEELNWFLNETGLDHVEIEVDGGVKFDNAAEIVKAGANMLVCGSGLFHGDLVANISTLRSKAEEGLS